MSYTPMFVFVVVLGTNYVDRFMKFLVVAENMWFIERFTGSNILWWLIINSFGKK